MKRTSERRAAAFNYSSLRHSFHRHIPLSAAVSFTTVLAVCCCFVIFIFRFSFRCVFLFFFSTIFPSFSLTYSLSTFIFHLAIFMHRFNPHKYERVYTGRGGGWVERRRRRRRKISSVQRIRAGERTLFPLKIPYHAFFHYYDFKHTRDENARDWEKAWWEEVKFFFNVYTKMSLRGELNNNGANGAKESRKNKRKHNEQNENEIQRMEKHWKVWENIESTPKKKFWKSGNSSSSGLSFSVWAFDSRLCFAFSSVSNVLLASRGERRPGRVWIIVCVEWRRLLSAGMGGEHTQKKGGKFIKKRKYLDFTEQRARENFVSRPAADIPEKKSSFVCEISGRLSKKGNFFFQLFSLRCC